MGSMNKIIKPADNSKIVPTNKNTNLFYQLYSTSNDITSSGFTCSSAIDEADTSFDIVDGEGVITDSNGDELASIDMTDIHADGITEYYTETKILQPYSAYLLQGNVTGDTYAAQFFPIVKEIQSIENYEPYINVKFDIHYTSCEDINAINIDTYLLRTEPGSVCELIQAKFDELGIPVNVTIQNLPVCDCNQENCVSESIDYLVFQSSSEGYSFYVHSVLVSAIDAEYINHDGTWADYTETPFIGANVNFDYIIDLIKTLKPRLKGSDEDPDYSDVPCDIYKFFISIGPLAINDPAAFNHNVHALEKFLQFFDHLGNIIEGTETKWSLLCTMYPDIYAYYWGNEYSILNTYNIHDIFMLLLEISKYVHQSNVSGPYMLVEDYNKRILNQKYPNGAMRGLVLIPDWSEFTDEFSVLKVAHVSDYVNLDEKIEIPKNMHVEGFVCNECVDVYRKVRSTVKINTILQSEYEVFKACDCFCPVRKVVSNESLATCMQGIWTYDMHSQVSSDSEWTTNPNYHDTNSTWSDTFHHTHTEHHNSNHDKLKTSCDYVNEYKTPEKYNFMENVPGHRHGMKPNNKENAVGLYRYMQYLNENDLWLRVGEAYMIIGAKDNYQSKIKNLQNSVLVYNPNPLPVRIKFMVFS